jgi:uncharacterized protein (TIGR02145 family)
MEMYSFKKYSRRFILLIATSFIAVAGCKKEENETIVNPETGTMTDVEGNIYKTVKIGSQWWMAENLKTTKYRNGFLIPLINSTDITEWKNSTSAAYCFYGTTNSENHQRYGFLYNWYVLSDTSNIAPAGWHVPTDEEWKEMERQVGMSSSEADKSGWRGTHEGEKLKIEGTEDWSSYQDMWPTNKSGFSALSGNCRVFNGEMGAPSGFKQTGFWWTISSIDSIATYRYLDYKNAKVFRGTCSKNYGFSLRCVKD